MLADTTKTTLGSLLYLLGVDMSLSLAIRSAADRLLPADQAAAVIGLCGKNPNGQNMPADARAALAADIVAG